MSSDIDTKSDNLDKLIAKPEGVLAIHVKRAFNIRLRKKIKIRLLFDKTIRETKQEYLSNNHECLFDEIYHLSIRLIEDKEENRNFVKIEIVSDHTDQKTGEVRSIVESYFIVWIFEIIRCVYVPKCIEFKSKLDEPICSLEIDFCFSYGQFGYGYSNQLNNSVFSSSIEYLGHSIFRRVDPPEYRKVSEENQVLEAVTVEHPKLIRFSVKNGHLNQIDLPDIHRNHLSNQFPLTNRVLDQSDNFARFKTDMSCILNRSDRLDYLRSILNEN